MGPDIQGISCCFDEESRRMLDDFRKDGLGDTSEVILSVLKTRGLAGATSLELGCGVGGLTLQLLKEGASSAVGVDLSPKMVETARSLAAEQGLSGRATFQVGDGATATLGKADVVVLDTVVCCYPDFAALVQNSSSAARLWYAISLPDDSRLATRALRIFLPLQRAFFRRGSFRFFIHPKKDVVAMLLGRGFSQVSDTSVGHIWSVLVFAAQPPT